MKYLRIILFTLVTTALCISCDRSGIFSEGKVVASVGDKKLYAEDLKSLFVAGQSSRDSLLLLESYVDMWVKKELKIQEAERLFDSENSDIEKMVEDYRSSLLSHKLDQYFVSRNLDSLYDDNAVAEYYESHKSDFILDRAIFKGAAVRIPQNYRQLKQLKESMGSSGEKYRDFVDTAVKNEFEFVEYTDWTEFPELLAFLPASVPEKTIDQIAGSRAVTEIKAGQYIYLIKISSWLSAGDASPLERVSDVIRQVLYNQRRADVIRTYEDSIYRAALENRNVHIYIEKEEQ